MLGWGYMQFPNAYLPAQPAQPAHIPVKSGWIYRTLLGLPKYSPGCKIRLRQPFRCSRPTFYSCFIIIITIIIYLQLIIEYYLELNFRIKS